MPCAPGREQNFPAGEVRFKEGRRWNLQSSAFGMEVRCDLKRVGVRLVKRLHSKQVEQDRGLPAEDQQREWPPMLVKSGD